MAKQGRTGTMRFKITEKGGVSVVSVTGDVSNSAVDEFMRMIMDLYENGRVNIVLDLSKCTRITGINLSILMYFKKRISAKGGDIRIACAGRAVTRYFRRTGADRIFHMHQRREGAIFSFSDHREA